MKRIYIRRPPEPDPVPEAAPEVLPHFAKNEVESRVQGYLKQLGDLSKRPQQHGKEKTKPVKNKSSETFRKLDSETVSKKKETCEVPVILSRRDVAIAARVPHDRVYAAAARNLIRPDFLDMKGAQFFIATRLGEIVQVLKAPEVIA